MTTPLNNKKGTTLVELMVCLVLLALFGTAAVTLVKPCAEAYIEVQQLTRAQNLADADGTISIVNAATNDETAGNIFVEGARLTEGNALRFTVESNYTEILDAGYVPKLEQQSKNAEGNIVKKTLYDPADDTFASLNSYLHMRFYKQDGNIYAYTTAYPNGDYMGLVISNLKFYARGWEEREVANDEGTKVKKICLTSLSMQLTVAKPDGTSVYTQTAVIPLPGAPEFQ